MNITIPENLLKDGCEIEFVVRIRKTGEVKNVKDYGQLTEEKVKVDENGNSIEIIKKISKIEANTTTKSEVYEGNDHIDSSSAAVGDINLRENVTKDEDEIELASATVSENDFVCGDADTNSFNSNEKDDPNSAKASSSTEVTMSDVKSDIHKFYSEIFLKLDSMCKLSTSIVTQCASDNESLTDDGDSIATVEIIDLDKIKEEKEFIENLRERQRRAKERIENHWNFNDKAPKFKCDHDPNAEFRCLAYISGELNFIAHKNFHTTKDPEYNLMCHFCGARYRNLATVTLTKHLKKHHGRFTIDENRKYGKYKADLKLDY